MITRQRLLEEKRVARKMDYYPKTQTIHMLVDAALELMDKLDGGQDQRDWQQERAVTEAQLRLALIDLDATLANAEAAPTGRIRLTSVMQARFTIEMIREMLSEKRLAWRKNWAWYRPRIDEEFADA